MTIKVVRIDDRLIHGQIVQGWLKLIQIDKILVVSDEVAKDEMQKVLLSMAVPSNIKNIKDASYDISNNVYEKDNLMILFSNPHDIVRMLDNGIKFNTINIGGMHFAHGKKQLLPNLSVDRNDIEAFLKLIER